MNLSVAVKMALISILIVDNKIIIFMVWIANSTFRVSINYNLFIAGYWDSLAVA